MMTELDKSKMLMSFIETRNDKNYIVSINPRSMNAYIFPIDDCIRIDLTSVKYAGEVMDCLFDMVQDKRK